MVQAVIGLFDKQSEAKQVVADLLKNGFAQNEVTATGSSDSPSAMSVLSEARVPAQDQNFYNEGVRRGGTLVMVRADSTKAAQAANIMSRYNMVDIDARLAEYTTSGAKDIGLSTLDQDGQVLQVIEEQLEIGKRQVQRGGVRIHTIVTERAVEAQVTLRDETISVERRPANRDLTSADMANLKDQTFTVTETDEEAVVSKVARIVEEVVVGKTAEDRTETVRDTVRRQDVDVQQLNTTNSAATTGYATHDADFRAYYTTNLAKGGQTYEQHTPVFRYGYDLGTNERYQGKDWASIETDARTSWEQRNPGTWEQFKDSIRYAWDRSTNKR